MLDSNNPDIDVEALMVRVQHEVLRRQYGAPAAAAGGIEAMDVSGLESLIAAAVAHGGPRTRWPGKLWFFPGFVQRFGLRAVGWLLRDQLAFNAAMVQALRESVALNARLQASIRELDARVRQLEGRG